MRTRPIRVPQNMANCVYSIACECGRSYTGETRRPLVVRLREQRQNLEEGNLERSKVVQHACGQNHHIVWKEAKSLETKINSVYRKYNEAANKSCLKNSIRQSCNEISPIWYPLISKELSKYVSSQEDSQFSL
jgi:predicted GIY-YIG superfamily endonuclease